MCYLPERERSPYSFTSTTFFLMMAYTFILYIENSDHGVFASLSFT